jgi:hypothetical protein
MGNYPVSHPVFQRGQLVHLGVAGGIVQTIALVGIIFFLILVAICCSNRLPAKWQEELRAKREAYWNEYYAADTSDPDPPSLINTRPG